MDNQAPTINTNRKMTILAINTNSLISNQKRDSLLQLLNRQAPDFALLSETKVNSNHNVAYAKYRIHRTDRITSKQGGGTAILVNKTIKHSRIYPKYLTHFKLLEATIIENKYTNAEKIIIISAYSADNSKMEFITELDTLFTELLLDNPNVYYILAGDLNARHSSWKNNNTRGLAHLISG